MNNYTPHPDVDRTCVIFDSLPATVSQLIIQVAERGEEKLVNKIKLAAAKKYAEFKLAEKEGKQSNAIREINKYFVETFSATPVNRFPSPNELFRCIYEIIRLSDKLKDSERVIAQKALCKRALFTWYSPLANDDTIYTFNSEWIGVGVSYASIAGDKEAEEEFIRCVFRFLSKLYFHLNGTTLPDGMTNIIKILAAAVVQMRPGLPLFDYAVCFDRVGTGKQKYFGKELTTSAIGAALSEHEDYRIHFIKTRDQEEAKKERKAPRPNKSATTQADVKSLLPVEEKRLKEQDFYNNIHNIKTLEQAFIALKTAEKMNYDETIEPLKSLIENLTANADGSEIVSISGGSIEAGRFVMQCCAECSLRGMCEANVVLEEKALKDLATIRLPFSAVRTFGLVGMDLHGNSKRFDLPAHCKSFTTKKAVNGK